MKKFVAEKKVLTLAEGIQRMTELPARRLGLKDRGLIAPGRRADIVALDSLAGCHARLVLAGGRVADAAAFAAASLSRQRLPSCPRPRPAAWP